MKRILIYVLSLTLIISSFGNYSFAEEVEIQSFSLEKAIEYGLKNNKDIKIKEIELAKAKVVYEDKIRDVKNGEKNADILLTRDPSTGEIIPDATVTIGMITSGALRKSVELPYKIAQLNLEMKRNQIKYNIEKAYYDLLQVKKDVEIAQENLSLSKKQYEQGQLKYKLGTISEQQLLGLEMGMLQGNNIYASSKMYYDIQKLSFQNTIGMFFNEEFNLIDDLKARNQDEIDLEKSIKLGLDNNGMVKISVESLELSNMMFKAIRGQYPENTYRYREQEEEVLKAEKSLETAKNGIEMSIRIAILNLNNAKEQIKIYEKAVEQGEKALRIAEVSFDIGQGTYLDIIQGNINLLNARKNLSGQIHALNMAILDYEYSLGLGKGM